MKFIDSHTHLDFDPLKSEQQAVIERAYKAGVEFMVNVGSSMRGSKASVEIANSYPHIWATVGLHPHDAETAIDLGGIKEELLELAKNDKVVAVGEIGLDFFDQETGGQKEVAKEVKERQIALFEMQLDLAIELDLPVVIHTRDAETETLNILKEKKCRGVVHCFTSGPDFAKKILELGFCVGFTGFVTFEQAKFDHIRESVKAVPMDKLLIETDAPFLAPEPYRGKPNEPAYVIEVAKKIAELKDLPIIEVAEKTLANTKKLFSLS